MPCTRSAASLGRLKCAGAERRFAPGCKHSRITESDSVAHRPDVGCSTQVVTGYFLTQEMLAMAPLLPGGHLGGLGGNAREVGGSGRVS